MAKIAESRSTVRKMVVFFDICSSTKILEDLIRTENEEKWRELLVAQKNFLKRRRDKHGFNMYKFLGDGWVLLFPTDVSGGELMAFLRSTSDHYVKLYRRKIKPLLTVPIDNVGLTFGIDRGTLLVMTMNVRREYAGRALNIAARLQSSIGQQKESHPENKVLMSNSVYVAIASEVRSIYRIDAVRRELKNISGGENYLCKKLWLHASP